MIGFLHKKALNACIQKALEMQKENGEAIWLFLVKPPF